MSLGVVNIVNSHTVLPCKILSDQIVSKVFNWHFTTDEETRNLGRKWKMGRKAEHDW
jgi:hypothetical protein